GLLPALAREDPVAGRALLADGEEAVGARDHGRALGRDVIGLEGASGLEELGGHDHVDISGRWIQREDGLGTAGGNGLGIDLEIVGGGARALGDTRNGRGLSRQPRMSGGARDPLGENAPALAPERRDQNGDGAGRGHHAAWRRPITQRRAASSARSHWPGLWTTRVSKKDGQRTAACATSPQSPQPTQVWSTCATGSSRRGSGLSLRRSEERRVGKGGRRR